jgi:catechol 1,2-dioxygenase
MNDPRNGREGSREAAMIINNQEDVTKAVLAEIARAPDPRFREIMSAFVRHLHEFAREVRLTEEEFQKAIAYIVALGQKTTDSHNEAVLMSGSLGFSTLICLLNNGNRGATETTAWVKDLKGNPVAGADIDVWHSSTEGYYENQDPVQADMNLRGTFTTDQNGQIHFRTIKPSGYPIPVDGPTGDLLRAQGRANMRPAHLHFLIHKPGFKTHISQVYSDDDPHLETDSQFGVTRRLIGHYVLHENEPAPAPDVKGPWYSLEYTFEIEPGIAKMPRPPITAKARGERPQIERLKRA